MFTVSQTFYLINIITKDELAEHLIPNIKGFNIFYYIKEEYKGGKPDEQEEKHVTKVQMLCSRSELSRIVDYIKQYYVKGYGAVCYFEEVKVPM